MLILFSAEGKTLDSDVSKRFGHSKFFLLYNTDTLTFEVFDNDEGEHHNHNNLSYFLNQGVRTFVVGNIGPEAFEVINQPDVKIYRAIKMTVEEALDKLLKNELKQLTEPTISKSIGHHHNEEGHHHNEEGHHHNEEGHHHNHSHH
jgi:predicted Fe-Mo cluster-binding NifX family protein